MRFFINMLHSKINESRPCIVILYNNHSMNQGFLTINNCPSLVKFKHYRFSDIAGCSFILASV